MTREIKFRAWDGLRLTTSGISFSYSTGWVCVPVGSTLEQFTGLHDHTGEEIYEGDILKCSTLHPDDHETPGLEVFNTEVRFSPSAGFITGYYAFPVWSWSKELGNPSAWCKRIGNIHEHPELLKS